MDFNQALKVTGGDLLHEFTSLVPHLRAQYKHVKLRGPRWFAVGICHNCDGMQLTSSALVQANRWKCVTCGEVCDLGWVEDGGRDAAIESIDKALDAFAKKGDKPVTAWEQKAHKLHAQDMRRNGCKLIAMQTDCNWCD